MLLIVVGLRWGEQTKLENVGSFVCLNPERHLSHVSAHTHSLHSVNYVEENCLLIGGKENLSLCEMRSVRQKTSVGQNFSYEIMTSSHVS